MKIFLLSLCLALAYGAAPDFTNLKRYDGYKVLSITPLSLEQQEFVHSLGDDFELDVWKETTVLGEEVDIMVPPHKQEPLYAELIERGITYRIENNNVQEDMDRDLREFAERAEEGWAYNPNAYNTYDDINSELSRLAGLCSGGISCSVSSIGNSYEGRAVNMLTISGGSGREGVWLDSLIHCREWLAGSTLMLMADRIVTGFKTDRKIQQLLERFDFYIVPVVNPDGYIYTWTNERMWRKNRQPNSGSSCIGTDLNRNHERPCWRCDGTSTLPCSDTYGGASPASSPEVTNVQNAQQGLSLQAMVSYHSYAYMWLHPWGHSSGGSCARSPAHSLLNRVANAAADATAAAEGTSWRRGTVCEVIYAASGGTVDYSHDIGVPYSYTPELRGNSFNPPTSFIGPSFREIWAGTMAMLDEIIAIEGE